MLNMAEKLSEAGLVPPRPAKTTFPDGRMATKEAWNYCVEICKKRKAGAPTLQTFKWHLKHGNLIEAGRVPNPFGGAGPAKVYAITCEAVVAFVDELEKRPGELEAGDKPSKKGTKRRRAKGAAPPTPAATPKRKTAVDQNRELKTKDAFAYLHRNIPVRSDLNTTTFGFYLAYDVISSRLEKTERFVKVGDLDAFLELAPDGVYANHINYLVAPSRGPSDLSLKDAYDYYREIDPVPISITSFRSVVAAGIISAIRTANNPKAMVVGFRRQDINGFLATRQRLQEMAEATRKEQKEKEQRTTLVAAVMTEALAKANLGPPPPVPTVVDTREAPEPKKTVKAKTPKVVVKAKPKTKAKPKVVAKTKAVVKAVVKAAVEAKPKSKTQKSWPIEKAYYKFGHLIPPGISMLQFKQLVNTGIIRSITRASVVHIRFAAVEAYFEGLVEKDPETVLLMGPAYSYYCSQCEDPVQKARFSRWLTGGDIEGAVHDEEDDLWAITVGLLDEFLEKYPTGRMRPSKPKKKAKKEGLSKAAAPLPEVPEDKAGEAAPASSLGTVSVSLGDYPSGADMKIAIELLKSQGFDVQVKP